MRYLIACMFLLVWILLIPSAGQAQAKSNLLEEKEWSFVNVDDIYLIQFNSRTISFPSTDIVKVWIRFKDSPLINGAARKAEIEKRKKEGLSIVGYSRFSE